jgi:hypothetical protein
VKVFKNILKKIFNKKNIKWFALIFIIIIVFILFFLRRNVDEVIIEDHDLFQYFYGIKVEYSGSIKMNKDDDGITQISFKKETVELDSTPIYFKDEDKVIFPTNMSVVYPILGTQYKLNYYATLYSELEDIYVKDGSYDNVINNAIIYDGDNLYFLTCDCTVKVGNEEYDLNAMSYVIVDTLNSVVNIYDYKNDDYIILEDISDEVIIYNDSIKVNASLDLMYYNNKSRLLLKSIDKLNNLKK